MDPSGGTLLRHHEPEGHPPRFFLEGRRLTRKINAFVEHDNSEARPFVRVATGESILGKIEHLCKAISRTLHQGQTMLKFASV